MSTLQFASGALVVAAAIQVTVSSVLPAVEPVPPIDLLGVELVGDQVLYHRKVTVDYTVRSAYAGAIIDVETEQAIDACNSSGSSDYGPQEKEKQLFPFEPSLEKPIAFFPAGCSEALTDGREYRIYAAVTPIGMEPDWIYGTPFVWGQ